MKTIFLSVFICVHLWLTPDSRMIGGPAGGMVSPPWTVKPGRPNVLIIRHMADFCNSSSSHQLRRKSEIRYTNSFGVGTLFEGQANRDTSMNGEPAETTGQRLKRLREAAGLSQHQLAAAAGVQVASLQNWEQDRRSPNVRVVRRLANALGVSTDQLIGD